MTQHKDFDAARAEATGEAISFTFGGEEFAIPQPVPILPLLDLAAIDPEEAKTKGTTAFRDLIFAMLDQADIERFREACTRSRADLGVLTDIVTWLVEVTTQVPTEPQSDSQELRLVTGDTSNTVSDEVVSTLSS